MSDYLIALIAILVFAAVIYVIWKGGSLRVGIKDVIDVDAKGRDQKETSGQPSPDQGASLNMTAEGEGSAIRKSTQSVSDHQGGSPKLKMSAKDGGKITDAEQRVSEDDQEQ